MYFEVILAISAGIFIGAAGIYFRQRRCRQQELQEITKIMEDILNERKVKATVSGEDTLYAKIENQLVRVQEMMQGRRDAAEQSRDEIQKLISEIAHQMRTPLMNMQTYLGFLQESMAEEPAIDEMNAGYIAAMEKSMEKLYFLVENFIKISRLEHHIIQIKKEETDILKTLRNALGQIQNQAEKKAIQFDIALPAHAVCLHDSNWLGEAVYNILDNAVKYSESGNRIEVSVSENEMFLKIRVRDYGIGIEAGEENLIFKRFYRGKYVTTQEGFGIGLYLAREIVNRHGGFLAAKRMQGGLLMEISLPSNVVSC